MGIALYHDEACWANPDPDNDACSSGELMVDEIENNDTTWAYLNEHVQNWSTGRLNLAIRGYVANDGQDGEDMDGLLRGDESKAGVTVKLLNAAGTKTLGTTETDADGYYEFDGLEAGSYTVSASSGSNYRAIHAINRHPRTRAWRYVTSKTATAEEYTLNPDEADLAKPFWNRAFLTTGRTMGNGTVTYTEGEGTAARSDKYYNFALVYTDGEFTGKVNNLSGSDASIDVVLEVPARWTPTGRPIRTLAATSRSPASSRRSAIRPRSRTWASRLRVWMQMETPTMTGQPPTMARVTRCAREPPPR